MPGDFGACRGRLGLFAARLGDGLFFADRDVLDLPAELAGEDLRGVGVERGVDVDAGHAHARGAS